MKPGTQGPHAGIFDIKNPNTIIKLNQADAKLQLSSMQGDIRRNLIQALMVPLQKLLRRSFEGLWVNMPSLEAVKDLIKSGDHVVLLPTYKSFADQFVILYTLFANNMEVPFTIGNREDTPRVKAVDEVLKRIGYIIAMRTRDQSIQQSYVNQAVLRELMTKHPLSMMF